MTKFTQKSFAVHAPGSKQYADNWERTFRASNDSDNEATPVGFPKPSDVELKEIADLRASGDKAWERGDKSGSDGYHREASALSRKFGLNVERCVKCGVYDEARRMSQHLREKHS